MAKTILIYYSYEGSTKKVATIIKEAIDCDVLRLEVIGEKVKKGLNKYLWGGRQVLQKVEPKINPRIVDLTEYDTVIIATPIWAGSYAPAIRTFLSNNDLSDKNIKCVYTHKGGPGKIEKTLTDELDKKIDFLSLKNVNKDLDGIYKQIVAWVK